MKLPLELFVNIGGFSFLPDLAALAQSSKKIRNAVTPLIYNTIDLRLPEDSRDPTLQVIRCLTTLCDDSNGLINLVQTLRLEEADLWWIADDSRRKLTHLITETVEKMTAIRHFHCSIVGCFGFRALRFMCEKSTLQSFSFSYTEITPNPGVTSATPIAIALPALTSFSMTLGVQTLTDADDILIESLVRHIKPQLTHLAIPHIQAARFFTSWDPDSLPRVEQLSIFSNAEISADLFGTGSRLKTLILEETRPRHRTPETALLQLERFEGSSISLIWLMTTAPRPIRIIHLDRVTWSKVNRDGKIGYEVRSTSCPQSLERLPLLAKSTGPVQDLAFRATSSHSEDIIAMVIPIAPGLERLKMSCMFDLSQDTLVNIGRNLLSHCPLLMSFLLCDRVLYDNEHEFITDRLEFRQVYGAKSFSHARDLDLQQTILAEWTKYCPTLEEIALTHLYTWRKRPNGDWELFIQDQ